MDPRNWPNLYRITIVLGDKPHVFYEFAMGYDDCLRRTAELMQAVLLEKKALLSDVNTISIERLRESYGFTDSAIANIKRLTT